MLWRTFPILDFMIKFQNDIPLFLEIPDFLYNTVYNRAKEASITKLSSIRPYFSIYMQYWFVAGTDRHRHRARADTAL